MKYTKQNERKEVSKKGMKKKILAVALAISIIAILSVGSLAWFTDEDTISNRFMVAQSTDDNPDDVFSVDVYEIDPADGTTEDQDGIDYPDVLPGDELEKEAHIRNTGYYDQYVRVVVTVSDAPAWQAILGTNFNDARLLQCFDGFDQSLWTHMSTEVYDNGTAADTTDDVIRIVLYLKDPLNGEQNAPAGDVTVFNKVLIPSEMDQTTAVLFDDDGTEGFTIDILAQAVQTENVVPDGTAAEDACYAAFQTVGMTY